MQCMPLNLIGLSAGSPSQSHRLPLTGWNHSCRDRKTSDRLSERNHLGGKLHVEDERKRHIYSRVPTGGVTNIWQIDLGEHLKRHILTITGIKTLYTLVIGDSFSRVWRGDPFD